MSLKLDFQVDLCMVILYLKFQAHWRNTCKDRLGLESLRVSCIFACVNPMSLKLDFQVDLYIAVLYLKFQVHWIDTCKDGLGLEPLRIRAT